MKMMTTIQTHPLNPTKNMIGLGYKLWGFCATLEKEIGGGVTLVTLKGKNPHH